MILAGDIGGTSTRLGVFELSGTRPVLRAIEKHPSRDAKGLEEIVTQFLRTHPVKVDYACFGVAGPVREGRVRTPNLPWVVDAAGLAGALKLEQTWLINDLEANAYGVATLEPDDLARLNEGRPDMAGNAAIISAGTGLGEAGFYFDGRRYRPFACEGGHSDFAPADELQIELLQHLMRKFGHVSYERVLSGPGLSNVYEFLRDSGRGKESVALAERLRTGDPSAVISEAGLEGGSDLCVRALEVFVSIYGAEAGNLALKMKATRGVLIGGGIAPKIIRKLKEPGFMRAFAGKGRMSAMMEAIPVGVILNDHAALFGAALYAALEAGLVEHPLVAA